MSSFTSKLYITETDNPREWKLTRSFTYYLTEKGRGWKIIAPRGFVTNFASVPRGLWWLIPPYGRYGKAAVIHDYLYSVQVVSKKVSDAIFYEAMEILKVPFWKKKCMYQAVNLFGKKAWNKNTKKAKR